MNILTFPPRQPPPTEPGNAVLEVVRDYLERVHPARVMARGMVDCGEYLAMPGYLPDADFFLAWLASEGFKVVPLD